MAGNVFRRDAPAISLVAARVDARVAVHQFAPLARARQADAIIVPLHRREIHNDRELMLAIRRRAQEGEHAALAVVAINPVETGVVVIRLPERGCFCVKRVQVLDKFLQAAMERPGVEQPPIERRNSRCHR